MKNILVLGASGLVGKALIDELCANFDVYGTYNTNKPDFPADRLTRFDVSDVHKIKSILSTIKPEIVISALRGDFNDQLAVHKEIAEHLKETGGKLYFLSSLKVYDNDITGAHYERDTANARSEYGIYKIECEKVITEVLDEDAIILRLPMLWGKNSPRFISLLSKLKNNEEIELPVNLFMSYSSEVFVAKQIHYIIENNLKGIFHLGTTEAMNYHSFIKALISGLEYTEVNIKETLLPVKEKHLAILSSRTDIPIDLQYSNGELIHYLTE